MVPQKVLYPAVQAWLIELARPFLRFMQEEHKTILTKHREFTGGDSYNVGGAIYGPGGMRPRTMGKLFPLPAQLLPMHQSWMANCDRHANEWVRAEQVLKTCIGRAQTWQDIRDMIPDHVLRPFPAEGLMVLQRERPDLYAGLPHEESYAENRRLREAYWEPKLLDLYESVASTIDLYVSYRIL